MSTNLHERLYRPGEAARLLRCSEVTVRRMLGDGRLDGVKLGHGPTAHWRVRASALDRLLDGET